MITPKMIVELSSFVSLLGFSVPQADRSLPLLKLASPK
jgi:hypothetical protein